MINRFFQGISTMIFAFMVVTVIVLAVIALTWDISGNFMQGIIYHNLKESQYLIPYVLGIGLVSSLLARATEDKED